MLLRRKVSIRPVTEADVVTAMMRALHLGPNSRVTNHCARVRELVGQLAATAEASPVREANTMGNGNALGFSHLLPVGCRDCMSARISAEAFAA
jgi:hypothetical protein